MDKMKKGFPKMAWNAQKLDAQWPFEITETRFNWVTGSDALIVVDMQKKDYQVSDETLLAQQYPEISRYWNRRMKEIVVPGTRRLLELFRHHARPVIYTRNGPWTNSASEMTTRLKDKLRQAPSLIRRGDDSYDIIDEITPRGDDIVIDKLTSGAFTQTILDHVLRNLGITHVLVAGILTDMCILGTARTAVELGYYTAICEDACASLTQRAHDEALLMHARTFGTVYDSEMMIHLFVGDCP